MTHTKHTFYAMREDRNRPAETLGEIRATNIDAALRQAKKKFGREVDYVITNDGLDFRR